MVLTWLLTLAAFFLIFAHLGFTWTEIPLEENPHALLGCITTGLCFVQPFMAIIRPHPGDTLRPLVSILELFLPVLPLLTGAFINRIAGKCFLKELTNWICFQFNWAHWFVGNSALGVGIAAIFLAVDLDKAELPAETIYLLISYVIFYAIVHILLTAVNCVASRRGGGGAGMQTLLKK